MNEKSGYEIDSKSGFSGIGLCFSGGSLLFSMCHSFKHSGSCELQISNFQLFNLSNLFENNLIFIYSIFSVSNSRPLGKR